MLNTNIKKLIEIDMLESQNNLFNYDALLLIDVQNTSTLKKYEIKDWGLTTNKCRQAVHRIKKLVDRCRKNNIEIIHILTKKWVESELPNNINKLYSENPEANVYSTGLPKSLIKINSNEKTFKKNNYSAWGGTNGELHKYISHTYPKNPSIIIAGFYSTGCVNSTIIEGFQNGIFWNIPINCVETFDRRDKQDYQNMLIKDWGYMVGHVVKSYNDLF